MSKVALRYAKSLFNLANEKGIAEAVNNDMILISKAINDSRDLEQLLKSPIVNCDRKAVILDSIFTGKVNEITLSFLKLLTHKVRENQLLTIAFHYGELYKEHKGILTATLTTAFTINDTLRNEILAGIERTNPGKQVVLNEKVKQDIIGGFILRVGDRRHDASVASSLRRLTKDFSGNHYINQN